MSDKNETTNAIPFYKSTKKTLGVIGFFCYWLIQIPAVIKDPTICVQMALANTALILGLLGIKAIGGAIQGGKK